MPMLDRTGPRGQGPRTGRGLGWCSPGYGRGYGRGWGWGWGQPTIKEEKDILGQEMKYLREEIKEIEKRLEELKKEKTK